MSGPKPKDLTGMRFGKLTVVEPIMKTTANGSIQKKWRCVCDCGGERLVGMGELTWEYGGVKSCGCSNIKPAPKMRKCNKTIKMHDVFGYNFVRA